VLNISNDKNTFFDYEQMENIGKQKNNYIKCPCGNVIYNCYELLNTKTNKNILYIGRMCIYKLVTDLTCKQKQKITCLSQLKKFDEIKRKVEYDLKHEKICIICNVIIKRGKVCLPCKEKEKENKRKIKTCIKCDDIINESRSKICSYCKYNKTCIDCEIRIKTGIRCEQCNNVYFIKRQEEERILKENIEKDPNNILNTDFTSISYEIQQKSNFNCFEKCIQECVFILRETTITSELHDAFNTSQHIFSFEINKQQMEQLNILQKQNKYTSNDGILYDVFSYYTEHISQGIKKYCFKTKYNMNTSEFFLSDNNKIENSNIEFNSYRGNTVDVYINHTGRYINKNKKMSYGCFNILKIQIL